MSGNTEVATRISLLRREAAELAAAEVGAIDAAQAAALHSELRAATDQLRALAARLLSVVESDGRWTADGSRTLPESVARREGISVGAARRELALGKALEEELPGTRRAVADGSITLEHAQVLSRLGPTSQARRAALASEHADRNEGFLLAAARKLPADAYRREVQRWATRVDADSAEREHEVATAKEHLVLARRDDGVAIQGFLTAENGAVLSTALRAVMGVPAADDERTPEQRAAAALAALARTVLDRGLAGNGAQVRPHLSVHVAWETMQALERPEAVADRAGLAPAELETGEPVPMSVLGRLLCDSEVTRVVFGPDRHVLDVGRAQRTYNGQLRRAVVARDRTCRYPGCDAPPSLGEVHHVTEWSRGGPTSVENGILLCWYHHDLVHRRGLRITRTPDGWSIARSDGTPLVHERIGQDRGGPPEPGSSPRQGRGRDPGDATEPDRPLVGGVPAGVSSARREPAAAQGTLVGV